MSVNKEGVRMIAAKGATYGDLSTSLSASSSSTDQEADESIFPDAQDADSRTVAQGQKLPQTSLEPKNSFP